jgi:Protein of unknown function (DUF3293)
MNGGRRRQLEAAYRATDYVVELPAGRCSLRVGRHCPELAALCRQHGLYDAAYLTASNPASLPQPAAVNAAANAALQQLLETGGKPWYSGHAIDPEGKWPAEDSFLVLGLPSVAAAALGRRFGQHAILIAAASAIPELLWLQDSSD